jgi:hypothetical protein
VATVRPGSPALAPFWTLPSPDAVRGSSREPAEPGLLNLQPMRADEEREAAIDASLRILIAGLAAQARG